ncbi:MAG TPA: hypothetical protein VFG56_01275 [Candidatus Saccharimonadales bacterium]|nr:hypothetical protein [Candidatus Saccharimonadales bacterium]
MGFWTVVGRLIAGKPAFEVPNNTRQTDRTDVAPAPVNGRIDHGRRLDSSGRKIIPEAQLVRSEYHVSGEHLQVSAFIRNNSRVQIEIDKVNIFGRLYQVNRWLNPGEEHETVVYRGPHLKSDAYKMGELYYKDCQSGDYFCALHQVDYRREPDGSFLPHGFHLIHPIKDI